jgi:hypothetical protein
MSLRFNIMMLVLLLIGAVIFIIAVALARGQ